MQQARVRRTACMQNLRVEVAKVQTLPATLKRSRHPRGTKIVTCRSKGGGQPTFRYGNSVSARPLELPPLPDARPYHVTSSRVPRYLFFRKPGRSLPDMCNILRGQPV